MSNHPRHQAYFTDFTGNIFEFYLDDNGSGKIPDDLHQYLLQKYNIDKNYFVKSLFQAFYL